MKLHIDIDCFFASAHRINNPQYNNIPIAVGGRSNLDIFETKKNQKVSSQISGAFTSSLLSPTSNMSFEEYFLDEQKIPRGIITTSSYEARAFGVKTAMSVSEALRWCPHLKVLIPNYPLYHKLSHQLKLLLEKEIPSLEQFSIDEFFGDISGWISDDDAYEFGVMLKEKIAKELQLPVSIGIAKSKWTAKLATEYAKPFNVKYIKTQEIENFTKDIPVAKFPGIGKQYQAKLKRYNIATLGELQQKKDLICSWGEFAKQLYHRVCGTDNEKLSLQKDKKSIGLGRSFDPLFCRDEAKRRITILSRHLSFIALKDGYKALTFALNLKYQYGERVKSHINTNRIFSELLLKQEMIKLFDKIDTHPSHAIVQVNLSLSNFQKHQNTTLDIFHYEKDSKQDKLTQSMQKLRDKHGVDIIKSGGELQ